SGWFSQTQVEFRTLLLRAFSVDLTAQSGAALAKDALWRMFAPLAIGAGALLALTLLAQLLSTNMGFSFKKLAPTFTHFNPIAKLKNLPRQNVPAAVQAAGLMAVIGYVLYLLIQDNLPRLILLPLSSVQTGIGQI